MSQALATAEWADPEVFAEQHPFTTGKFWLGRSPLTGQALGHDDDRHVCLVSGSRSGKGTTTIIPNLCLWPGSVVVVDPKGENATVTAARRGSGSEHCEGMGQAVHVLDPFRAAQVDDTVRSRFNPLDALDPNDAFTIDEAGRLADAIVVINPNAKEPFWDESARTMIKSLILHVLTSTLFKDEERNLVTIRRLITRGDFKGLEVLRSRGKEKLPSGQALLWYGASQNNAFGGVVAGTAETMLDMLESSPKQFQSVLQIAARNTEFLDSPGMQECISKSDFRLSDIKTDPKGVSVFLSLPQRYMGEHFRWLRMMITLIINEMEAVSGKPGTGHRVLMCLDEFAGLKRMEVIENAVAQIAGFGVKLFFVVQTLEQLKKTYQDGWETFLSNAGLKMFFGLDDHFSRDYVSKLIGDTELLRELATASQTTSQQDTYTTGTSSSKTWNTQESTGTSSSDNWKSMPFFLKHTAGLFAALSGNKKITRGETSSTANTEGGTDGQTEAKAVATGKTSASGMNESLHKRPLITPDEVGRYFGRINDLRDRAYPGMSLVLTGGQYPAIVQKTNYFNDLDLHQLANPHPDHGKSEPRLLPTTQDNPLLPEIPSAAVKIPTIKGQYDEPVVFNRVELLKDDGSNVSEDEPIMVLHYTQRLPFQFGVHVPIRQPIYSPATGTLKLNEIPNKPILGHEIATIDWDVEAFSEASKRDKKEQWRREDARSFKWKQQFAKKYPDHPKYGDVFDREKRRYGRILHIPQSMLGKFCGRSWIGKSEMPPGPAICVSLGQTIGRGDTVATLEHRTRGPIKIYSPYSGIVVGFSQDGRYRYLDENGEHIHAKPHWKTLVLVMSPNEEPIEKDLFRQHYQDKLSFTYKDFPTKPNWADGIYTDEAIRRGDSPAL